MQSTFLPFYYDLTSPDGYIAKILSRTDKNIVALVKIDNIPSSFVGFSIEKEDVFFNMKSTLAQLGINCAGIKYDISSKLKAAEVEVEITSLDPIGKTCMQYLEEGSYIGKLFACAKTRRVRDPEYLSRMFGRSDRDGSPLLTLGGAHGSEDLKLEKIDGRTIAYLALKNGVIEYEKEIEGFLPTLGKSLSQPHLKTRSLLKLNQTFQNDKKRVLTDGRILLVKTLPLHVRTVFGKVVDDLLPNGYFHTSASILQPDTKASGDVYELYGTSTEEIKEIPLEFYTLEPYREHVFFSDRDQLQNCIEDPKYLFKAMETAPEPKNVKCATFVVKGEQLKNLQHFDWIKQESPPLEFPGLIDPIKQAIVVEKYIEQQPSYPFLEAIEKGEITSQGILLTRFFPSPLIKRMLLSKLIQRCIKSIYFENPSRSYDEFFSHEDRSLLQDLPKFGIPIFWVDKASKQVLQYIPKPEKDTGMFVPLDKIDTFRKSTAIGVYGSNLLEGNFEKTLTDILSGLLQIQSELTHPLFNPKKPLALITGGGPGVMSIGNKVAKSLGILSCANIVDFKSGSNEVINEQKQNPYIDAKMTYRRDRLIERQAEFHLDLPIFLVGGFGTDFEYTLEELRRKVGMAKPTPTLLLGPVSYWREKITSRFMCNLTSGTIEGSEWVSNCFYCVENAKQALTIYRKFFASELPIGKNGPVYKQGFFSFDLHEAMELEASDS